ncbi:MAG: PatB family C-S lyase [Bacteroidales bacterium]|nr:PatB family C-S lyase [Bacteroidales bacterium]
MYNFDKPVRRENTACVKYDLREPYFGKADVLPMWVADMDFETPDFVRKAVEERAKHPVYGYSVRTDDYYRSVVDWVKRRHNWDIEREWVVYTPGIVPALNFSVTSFTRPGDAVLVQPPVYFPFFSAIANHGRKQTDNPLLLNGRSYSIDFDDFEKKARQASMFFLCSPHNPVGKCFTPDELLRMGELCLENNVLVVSDEIHNDLILPGFSHSPMAALSDDLAENTISCIAPSKTFNLAGLSTSTVIIKNEELRNKFAKALNGPHLGKGNLFGAVASQAAYTFGDDWVDELMQYVHNNFQLLERFLQAEIPVLSVTKAESTYMAWIEFRKTGLTDDEIKEKLIHEAGLGLSAGTLFGKGGEGFQRMNLAAPKSVVRDALERLKAAFR